MERICEHNVGHPDPDDTFEVTIQYMRDDMVDFARQKLESGYDFVIMGHNHRSHSSTMNGGTYINLGDWIDENTYAVFNGKDIRLKTFRH